MSLQNIPILPLLLLDGRVQQRRQSRAGLRGIQHRQDIHALQFRSSEAKVLVLLIVVEELFSLLGRVSRLLERAERRERAFPSVLEHAVAHASDRSLRMSILSGELCFWCWADREGAHRSGEICWCGHLDTAEETQNCTCNFSNKPKS